MDIFIINYYGKIKVFGGYCQSIENIYCDNNKIEKMEDCSGYWCKNDNTPIKIEYLELGYNEKDYSSNLHKQPFPVILFLVDNEWHIFVPIKDMPFKRDKNIIIIKNLKFKIYDYEWTGNKYISSDNYILEFIE